MKIKEIQSQYRRDFYAVAVKGALKMEGVFE